MRNLKIATKLILSFGVVMALFIICVVMALTSMFSISGSFANFQQGAYRVESIVNTSKTKLEEMQKNLYRSVVNNDTQMNDDSVAKVEQCAQAIQKDLAALKELLSQPENGLDPAMLDPLFGYVQALEPYRQQIINYAQSGRNTDAIEILEQKYVPGVNDATNVLNDLQATVNGKSDSLIQAIDNGQRISMLLLSGLAIVSLILTVVLCAVITRGLNRPIAELKEAAGEMAEGRLSAKITYRSKDELGQLADGLRATIETLHTYIANLEMGLTQIEEGNLVIAEHDAFHGDFVGVEESMINTLNAFNDVITRINQSADQVAGGADQVAGGAQALSQGATEQASAVQELSATIAEISSKVKDNAADAVEASSKVGGVSGALVSSNQQMQELISAMSEIRDSSNQISKIINTIKDIAFQTNLLALNAAVEAARAGAAGKGFTVVAEEVRALAAKSQEAAKDTTVLIQSSVDAVERGGKLADETAHSLLQVVEGAREVAAAVSRITLASNEQATSISQVSQGVEQISSVIQTNSATAEESAAASEELSGQAQVLKGLVGRFTLQENHSDAAAFADPGHPPRAALDYREDYSYGSKY